MQLSRNIDLRLALFSTAGAAAEIDASDCEGVMFVAVPASSAVNIPSMAIKLGATTTSFVDCASTFTHASSAQGPYCLVTDVYKPGKRWVGATVTSSSTGPFPYWTLAFKYGLRKSTTGAFSSTVGLSAVTGGVIRAISPTSAT